MTTKILKCFIASPSDTSAERELCDKVFNEINKGIGQTPASVDVQRYRWSAFAMRSFFSRRFRTTIVQQEKAKDKTKLSSSDVVWLWIL